jgi:hypothetical protein
MPRVVGELFSEPSQLSIGAAGQQMRSRSMDQPFGRLGVYTAAFARYGRIDVVAGLCKCRLQPGFQDGGIRRFGATSPREKFGECREVFLFGYCGPTEHPRVKGDSIQVAICLVGRVLWAIKCLRCGNQ